MGDRRRSPSADDGRTDRKWQTHREVGTQSKRSPMRRLGYRNRNPHEGPDRVPRKSRRSTAAVFTGAVVVMTIAIALPRVGTSEARVDPNRYGLRTVSAAGGSAATVAV